MKNLLVLFSLLFIISVFRTSAQDSFFPNKNYPANSFRDPLKIPTSLAGNYGECRPNHFHSGLDVRTEQRENMSIYSIQAGYVSRVTISHKGFGTCLYINHPGGFTSVYAHCNTFFGPLWKYIEEQQYKQKKWDIDIQLPPHFFPVKKGDYVAKSGNTGSSHAPHLHMEIRDSKTEKTLNGLLFYGQLGDDKKPIINRVAMYDGRKSIFEQEPVVYKAIKKGSYDVPTTELLKVHSDKAFFGIQANDYMENSLRLGVYKMKLIVDGKAVFGWQLDNIGYDETRYMNAIGDYKTKMTQGFWLQICHKLPNDKLAIYINKDGNNGMVDLSDGQVHAIIIRVYDVKGNTKDVRFNAQGISNYAAPKAICKPYFKNGEVNKYNNGQIAVELNKEMLYDNLCFNASTATSTLPYSHIYKVHKANVPVHDTFQLRLKPKQAFPENVRSKIVFRYSPNDDMSEAVGWAARYNNGWAEAGVKVFGNYEIAIDNAPPAITTSFSNGTTVKKGSRLKFTADDNLTSVKKIEVSAGKQWLRFARRKNNYYYYVDEHLPKGKQNLTIRAWDENDNMVERTFTINRL